MPAKYHIHAKPMPPRRKPIGKYCIIDWREDCSACHNCVKRECAYSVYNDERDRLRATVDYVDYLYECKGCLCCVQSCTKGLLTQQVSPEYEELGNEVWTPDIISSTWFQAETGRIPVSGAGYPGPFRGPGFDSILTDMSEIVRPTRDGIHGREYINTGVDIGHRPMRLEFDSDGKLLTELPAQVEVPMPVVFNMMPWHAPEFAVSKAVVEAAERLGTLAITNEPKLMKSASAIPHIPDQASDAPAKNARIAQWSDCDGVTERIQMVKQDNPDLVAMVKVKLGPGAAERCIQLASQEVDVLHIAADWKGYVEWADDAEWEGEAPAEPRPGSSHSRSGSAGASPSHRRVHISDAIREVHQAFVKAGRRDEVTIMASGGISMAEHVVKSLLCGADLVAIDVPLMIALECRVCENCRGAVACPIDISQVTSDYAVQRMVNLMGAWHSQMLEMMGAMGIREARRLRGEVGRAMFFDDLERECFGPVFGTRSPKSEVRGPNTDSAQEVA